jgi:opacity protein-like surface antigen
MMRMKTMLLAGVAALPFAVGAATAADVDAPDAPIAADPVMTGFYLRGDLGWAWAHTDEGDDDAFVGAAGIGYQFNDNFRADITGNWAGEFDIDGDDLSTMAILGTAYFDWANTSAFTPYIGAGFGYGWVDGSGALDDDDGLALTATAGVSANLTNNLAVDVGYRFIDIMTDDDVMEHQVTAGLRFSF